jgi:MoaA/NifB/PqqE/SkfB family radical SAM enzyme/phosphohistidine swiveling domain-containing protein
MSSTKKIRKTVIFTNYECNNQCVFCIDAQKRHWPAKTTQEIKSEILESRKRGNDYVEFIGGEFTIRKDAVLLIAFAKKIGFKTIAMATNGRLFSYSDYAKRYLDAGLTSIIFSIHGHTSDLHDSLTRSPGSLNQLLAGVNNFKKLGFSKFGSNTTIVKQNYKLLPEIGEFIKSLGISNSEFIFVDPNYGGAFLDFDELVPRISDAAPYIKRCLDVGKNFSHWHARYVPLCYFSDYLDRISELDEVRKFKTEHIAPDFVNMEVEKSRADVGRCKTDTCIFCDHHAICEGIWREYARRLGTSELRPVIGNKFGLVGGFDKVKNLDDSSVVVGGKGRGLMSVRKAGWDIPQSLVVPVDVLEKTFRRDSNILVFDENEIVAIAKEIADLFGFALPIIIRSSADSEDNADHSFAGVYESVVIDNLSSTVSALKQVVSSFYSTSAMAYREKNSLSNKFDLSVIIQHFHGEGLRGVSTIFKDKAVIVEVTADNKESKNLSQPVVFRINGDELLGRCPMANDQHISMVARASFSIANNACSGDTVSVEWIFVRERLVILQARTLPGDFAGMEIVRQSLDFSRLFFRVREMMTGMGFIDSDWSLGEDINTLEYNYTGKTQRFVGDRLEHFRVYVKDDCKITSSWKDVRYESGNGTIFPDPSDRLASECIEKVLAEGVFVIFVSGFPSLSKSRDFVFDNQQFSVSFVMPEIGFSREEEKYYVNHLSTFDPNKLRKALDANLEKLEKVFSLITPVDDFSCDLADHVAKLILLEKKKVELFDENKHKLITEEDSAVVGRSLVLSEEVIIGPILTEKSVKERGKRGKFVYVAGDLEPSFMPYVENMLAAVVSRCSIGSHAAAICMEFGIPLLTETSNIQNLQDGDNVSIDLKTGVISKI